MKNSKIILSAMLAAVLIISAMLTSAATAKVEPVSDIMLNYEGMTESETREYREFGEKNINKNNENNHDVKNIDEKMKEMLTVVKSHLDIDEEIYTIFDYNYYQNDYYNTEPWYFYWYSENYESSINATVLGNGKFMNYYKYDNTNYGAEYYKKNLRLAEVSKSEAEDIANNFLKKILGDEFDEYKLSNLSLSYPSDSYYINYVLTKDGYDFPDYTLSLGVDKLTGEVLHFYRYDRYEQIIYNDIDFQDASKVIPQDKALKSYLENIGLELVYMSQFDWQTKELTVKPVYRLINNYNKYINAVNGKVIEITSDYYYGASPKVDSVYEEAQNVAADSDSGEVRFSEAELAELEKAKNFISSDKAIEIMIKAFDLEFIDLSEYDKNAYLNKDYINQDQYCWSVYVNKYADYTRESYSATVDARNGNIIYFSGYSYVPTPYDYVDMNGDGIIDEKDGMVLKYEQPKPIYTYEEARKIVFDRINEISPYDIDENFELTENRNYAVAYSDSPEIKSDYYTFYLARKVNGISFDSNYISVEFNNLTGKINYYTLSWYEKAEFPKLDKIISDKTALNNIADFSGYNIYYISNGINEDGRANAVLVYRFDNAIMVDPFTGKCIDWSFEEAEKYYVDIPDYQDLNGHPVEDIVKILTDNGIYAWGGDTFDPDKGITKSELISYLQFYIYNSYYFSEISTGLFANQSQYYRYSDMLSEKPDMILTKQEAAKIICEIAGYGELGKFSEIFIYPFADSNCDEEYRGYVAILKVFGLISADEDGDFNAADTLTRAETAEIVYNLVMSFNK